MNKSKFARIMILLFFVFGIFFSPSQVLAQKSLSLVIHYSEATPNTDNDNYTVKLYFSVLDALGNPVTGLNTGDFKLTEDTKEMGINKVETAKDIPSHLILVIDASGSMRGGGIEAAQKAASAFVDRLGSRDRVAVYSFNDSVNSIIDFTADHNAVIEKIKTIEAIHNAGTCLYDATFQAVQIASTAPVGRRAVMVLTDGVDVKADGSVCSSNTIDDVINTASKETSPVPVYVMGIGTKINEQELKRMASRTSGQYLGSAEVTKIEDLFAKLSNSLNSEYVLEYTSSNAPGIHNLTLEANYKESKDLQTKAINLPAMPTTLAITSPEQNARVSGKVKITVSVPTKGEPIARLVFNVNDKSIGEVTKAPFEYDWDTAALSKDGQMASTTLSVIAYSNAGKELGRSESINVIVDTSAAPAVQEETNPTAIQTTPDTGEKKSQDTNSTMLLYGGIGLVVIIAAIGGFIFYNNKKKPVVSDEPGPMNLKGSDGVHKQNGPGSETSEELSISGMASLKILKAKDPNMVGNSYFITKPQTYIGSSAEFDLVFGPGTGVSRRHAIIEIQNSEYFIKELISPDGNRPKYGTFIDGTQLNSSNEPFRLFSGMVIRLGNLTEILFTNQSSISSAGGTFEEINVAQLSKETTEIKREG